MASTDVTTLKMLLVGEDRSASKTLRDVGTEADKAGEQLKGMGEDAAAGARLFEELPKNAKGAVDRSSAVFKQLAPEVKRAVIDASDTFQLLDQLPKTADGVVDETSRSFRELSPKMQDAVRDAQSKAAAEFKGGDTERAARQAGEGAGQAFGDGVEDGTDDAKAGFLSKIKGWKAGAVGALAGLGAAAAVAFTDGMDLTAGRAKLTAQLGLSEQESARAGKAAGELYAQNYGDSLEQTSEAIKTVIENIDGMRDASESTLTDMGARVITTSTLLDEDLGATARAVGQMMRTDMAKNAEEAFDIITAGMQNGVNKSQDLLDTINEYSTNFRHLGLDGADAMGLLSQGLRGGARDADQVADAIKEFTLRTLGSLETVNAKGERSLTELGRAFLDVLPPGADLYKVQEDLAAGGPRARAAFDQMLDGLRAIEDPLMRNQHAVALFGTMGEDMAGALLKMDASTAVRELGDLADASDKANTALNDTPMTKVMEKWRRLKGGAAELAAQGIDKVWPALTKLKDTFVDAMGGSEGFEETMDDLRPALKVAGTVLMFLAETAIPAAVKQFKFIAKAVRVTADGILWLFEKAAVPAVKFMLRGFAAVSDMFAKMLRALSRIPGFGWAKDAADKLSNAAREARGLATRLDEVGRKKPRPTVSLGGVTGVLSSIANIGYQLDKMARPRTAQVMVQRFAGVSTTGYVRRAGGGPVAARVPVIVGETGPETVMFDRATSVNSGRGHHRSAGGGSGPEWMLVEVVVRGEDGAVIERKLTKVKRQRGGKPLEFETARR